MIRKNIEKLLVVSSIALFGSGTIGIYYERNKIEEFPNSLSIQEVYETNNKCKRNCFLYGALAVSSLVPLMIAQGSREIRKIKE